MKYVFTTKSRDFNVLPYMNFTHPVSKFGMAIVLAFQIRILFKGFNASFSSSSMKIGMNFP